MARAISISQGYSVAKGVELSAINGHNPEQITVSTQLQTTRFKDGKSELGDDGY